MLAQVLVLELAADEPSRGRRDHDRVVPPERLQARREIGRVADDRVLTQVALTDHVAGNDDACRDADAHVQVQSRARLERGDGIDDAQGGEDRALGVVFVRPGIAEIHEDAVAHVACDEAVVAGDDVPARSPDTDE